MKARREATGETPVLAGSRMQERDKEIRFAGNTPRCESAARPSARSFAIATIRGVGAGVVLQAT
jgi:hypothetical protein